MAPPSQYTAAGNRIKNPGEGLIPKDEDRFPAKSPWVDVVWAVMFLLHTFGFIGVCAYGTHCFMQMMNAENSNKVDEEVAHVVTLLHREFWPIAAFMSTGVGVAICVSFMFFSLSMRFAKQVFWPLGTILVGILLVAITVYVYFVERKKLAVLLLLPLALLVLMGCCFRNSISMACGLFGGAARAVKANHGMKILALVAAFVYGISMFFLLSSWRFALEYFKVQGDTTMRTVMTLWGVFAPIWITTTWSNCLHCTYSGSCARYFYQGQERQDKSPTTTAMTLACTKYLGASAIGGFLDQFATCYVAIYGNSFWTSGKMVSQLAEATQLKPIFKNRALANFSLVISFYVATITCCAMFLLSLAIFPGLSLISSDVDFHATLPMYVIIFFFALILGEQMMRPLDSGARTLLIIFMEAPAYFQKSQPDAYNSVRDLAFKLKIVDKAAAHLGAIAPTPAD